MSLNAEVIVLEGTRAEIIFPKGKFEKVSAGSYVFKHLF